MTLIIDLPEELVAALQAKAAAVGLTLEAWLGSMAKMDVDTAGPSQITASVAHLQKSDPREWARQFREWADAHDPKLPILSDSAMTRESIYADPA